MSERKTPKGPSHIAYQVREGEDGASYFNRVGAAFAHKDGEGYNIVLESMPVDGRITLRTPQERLRDARDDAPRRRERDDRDRGR